jgi:hypothetical protein
MILTEENQSTWRKTCPSATLSAKNLIRIGLDLNSGLHGDKSGSLSDDTARRWSTKGQKEINKLKEISNYRLRKEKKYFLSLKERVIKHYF